MAGNLSSHSGGVTFFRTFLVGKLLTHLVRHYFFHNFGGHLDMKVRKPLIRMFRGVNFLSTFLVKILLIPLVGITFFITLVVSIFPSLFQWTHRDGMSLLLLSLPNEYSFLCFCPGSMSMCNASFVLLRVIFIISISI